MVSSFSPAVALSALPPARMRAYLAASGQDGAAALALYRWNAAVSAAMWEVLGYTEVVLRHAVDKGLTDRHRVLGRTGDWLDDQHRELDQRARDDIATAWSRAAKNRVAAGGGPATRDHVIAELSFGFWRFMLSRAREPKLGTAIRQQFPHARRGRSRNDLAQLRHLVEPLHHLRNRIAHHEPVWSANLAQRHDDAVGLIRITNPDLAAMVAGLSQVPSLLVARP